MPEMQLGTLVAGAIGTNVYLVMNKETKELIVIDPADEADRIMAKAGDMGGRPVAIFLTHGHFDHILAVNAIKEKYGIPVLANELEYEVMKEQPFGMMSAGSEIKIDIPIKDGDILSYAGFDIEVLHTPGHTCGSVCFYFRENGVLFSGDTLFRLSYGRTDFPTSSPRDMMNSIQRLLTSLPPETKVYPGHMGPTEIATEQRYNPLA